MRGKWEIIHDLLLNVEEGGNCKTRIMKRSYLDWDTFKKYFKPLIDNGYIKKIEENCKNGNGSYVLTEKGEKLLEEINDVEEIIKDDNLYRKN